ncbi:MAG: glycine zipper 2TM domain-containing protein [Pseudomonadota bacterium]
MKNLITFVGITGALSVSMAASADRWHGPKTVRAAAPAYVVATERYARNRAEYDFARVVDVQPIVRLVTVTVPQRACWDEEVVVRRERGRRGNSGSVGSTIAGGLIGGVVGRQIGGGSGRDAMTVVGALVGSAIGNNAGRDDSDRRDDRVVYDTVRRCETRDEVREEERIDGYRVTYLYNGREYTTRTRNHPGTRLRVRVRVSVDPAGRF